MASNKYDNTIDVAGQLIYNVNTHTVSTAGSANPPRNSVGVEGMQRQDYPNAIDLTDTVVSI
ncbi:MAG: hypothetical protein LBG52_07555 [Candidatus Peribacteria bacterium]|jgi:hypothetical protein|nr:hypothetical protein [Candidatus Peribacteria bacterium]